jgi:hypothetical protein
VKGLFLTPIQEVSNIAESLFVRADEVIRLLGVSKSEAYRIIKRLNDEMASKGYIVVNGRVNRRYLEEQIYGYVPEQRQGGK